LIVAVAATMLAMDSCRSAYHVSDVRRERVLIDGRYDGATSADAFMKPYRQRVDSLMSPVVGEVDAYMSASRPESNLSNLLADILVWSGKKYGEQPVLGIYNMGGIRASLAQGKVTRGDVLDVAPFENKACFLTLSGSRPSAMACSWSSRRRGSSSRPG